MTKRYEKETFTSGRLPPGARFEGITCVRCELSGCSTNALDLPRDRARFKDITLERCAVRGGDVTGAIIEDVVVDGLKTHGLHQEWACAYKHVTLRGKVGRIMTSPALEIGMPGTPPTPRQRAMDAANAAFYATVDWALDIRDAEFQEAVLRGIPARLVRRDPSSQVIITRARVADRTRWESIAGLDPVLSITLDTFLRGTEDDEVVVAPKAHKDFAQRLEGFGMLRARGILEEE